MLLTTNFEMTDRRRRRRPKVVPRAAADFVRQLKRKKCLPIPLLLEIHSQKNWQKCKYGLLKSLILRKFYLLHSSFEGEKTVNEFPLGL